MLPIGRLLCAAAVVSAGVSGATSYAALVSPGDVAFIGMNLDNFDDFAIVLLANAAATEVVHFTDRLWTGTQFTGSGTTLSWTVGSTVAAGTVVTFNNLNSSVPGASVSTGTLSGGTMTLSGADRVYAYVGSNLDAPSSFLAAISTSAADYQGPTGSLSGTGLTLGTTAILLPASGANLADGGQYTGVRTGAATFAEYLPLIGNTSSNWAVDADNGAQFVPFNTTPFQIQATAVSEPGALAMMLVALVMVCLSRCSKLRTSRAAAT